MHVLITSTGFAWAALVCAATLALAQSPGSVDERDDELDDAIARGEVIEITEPAPIVDAAAEPAEVGREEVRVLPGARGDAIESVRNLPGVAFASGFEGAAGDLVIRGTSGTDSWYLVDGVPIPAAMHLGNLTSVVPVDMLESIELYPGGFDVSQGRATGGIVELRTRRPRLDGWSGATEVSFVHASAFVEGPVWNDDVSVAVSVRRSFIDALVPLVVSDDADLRFTTAPRYADAYLRLHWTPGRRHEVNVLTLYSEDELALDLDTENANDPLFAGDIGTRDRFWRAIGSWRYDGDPASGRLLVGYGRDVEELGVNDTHFLDVRTHDVTVRGEGAVELAGWLKVRAGVDAHAVVADAEARIPIGDGEGRPDGNLTTGTTAEVDDDVSDLQTGAYLAADVRAGRVTFTPGVRVDHYSHIDDAVVQPRVAARLDAGRGWIGRAELGRFSRPHALAEQIPDQLEAETAIQASAGVERHFGVNVSTRATLFATWLEDLAVFDPTLITEDPFDGYVSRGRGTARGVEVLVRVRRGDLFGWVAYTFARSRRVDGPGLDERPFDYDQPHNLVAAASWRFGVWRFGGRFRIASGTPYTPVTGAVYLADADVHRPIYGAINSDRLEASHQLDLRVDRRFDLDRCTLSVYLDVSNVYANARVYGYAYDFDYSHREPLTDLPLLPSIGVRGEL